MFLSFLCALTFVCRTATAAAPQWRIDAVTSDLGCVNPQYRPSDLLKNSSQTTCNNSQIYSSVATLGTCTDCKLEPKGPGYYCEGGAASLCPAGYYCPDYMNKIICPKDSWCRPGFTQPMKCHTTAVSCPEGASALRPGPGAIIGLLLLLTFTCLASCLSRYRNAAMRTQAEQTASKVSDENPVLGKGFESETPSMTIGFEEVGLTLRSNGKSVLSGVTGFFPSSSMSAIMGPSGGGKTTFMNALCGRTGYGKVTGKVTINGKAARVADYPKLCGYVPQDDIMHCNLTVHQNLYFSAKLRLPASTSNDKVSEHVGMVVRVLGLEHVMHSVVGDAEKRGISGGQKKRVNIGMELVAMPSVIFMDEPTSGLDGAATVQLASCLHELSKSGLNIVCVIHQPRYQVFQAFSHLLLFGAGGRTVYFGECSRMESFFTGLGFRMPPKENPADWMIDITCGLTKRYHFSVDVDEEIPFKAPDDLFVIWEDQYKKKNPFVSDPEPSKAVEKDRKTPGIAWQTFVCFSRCCRQFDAARFGILLAGLFSCGAIFGGLTSILGNWSYSSLYTIITGNGFIFYMIACAQSRSVFASERLQYLREFRSGTSTVAFFLAKTLFNMLEVAMMPFAYSLPLYWLGAIPAQNYIFYYFIFFLASWYHTGMGMMFSVLFPVQTTNILLCIFVPMLLQLAFSGMLVSISSMSAPQLALSAITCGRWFNRELFAMEISKYPTQVLQFPEVEAAINKIDLIPSELHSYLGIWRLIVLGAVMRLQILIQFYLLKHSEGGNRLSMIRYIISKRLERVDIDILSFEVKADDIHGQGGSMARE